MQAVRARPALALLLVFLALAFLSSVAYAIGKVTGYIPGVELVNQTVPVRILDKPVKAKQSDITVTIRQMLTDADRTLVTYRVDGLLPAANGSTRCDALPFLQLSDDSMLRSSGGGGGRIGGEMESSLRFETTIYYPPVPTNINQVIFTLPCILPKGAGPENWQIPLHLSPAPKGYVLPALEVGATFVASTPKFVPTPTPFEAAITPVPNDPLHPALTPVPNGSGLYLERVVVLDHSYLLIGNFTDVGDLPGSFLSVSAQQSIPYEFHVTDRAGKPVSFSFRPDLMPPSDRPNVTYWALEVRKPFDSPITITLPEVSTILDDSFSFQIDVGTNPVIGQTWTLNRTVKVGDYSFRVEKIVRVEHGYTVELYSPLSREKVFLDLQLENHVAQGVYERFHERDGYTDFSETLIFKDEPPTGPLTFKLRSFIDSPIGPWTLTWTRPNQ